VNPVDVKAIVNNIVSPKTPADQFHYHGLWLRGGEFEFRLPVGVTLPFLKEYLSANEAGECDAFIEGGSAANGEVTDVIDMGLAEYTSCNPSQWFGVLPASYALRLAADGTATVEGSMGVRTGAGCVYEGNALSGSFGEEPLAAGMGGTFTLVAEEEPGAECAATERVFLDVLFRGLNTELVG
jgi:hypothetical protein